MFAEVRDLESSPPRWLRRWDGAGILTRLGSQAIQDAVVAAGVPAVELRATRSHHAFPWVGMDNVAVGQRCADYLAELGFRSFGVYGLTTETFFEERRDTFVRAIADREYECRSLEHSFGSEKPEQWERQQGIATRTGFASVDYFSHSFRSMFGQPPGSYRKRSS